MKRREEQNNDLVTQVTISEWKTIIPASPVVGAKRGDDLSFFQFTGFGKGWGPDGVLILVGALFMLCSVPMCIGIKG